MTKHVPVAAFKDRVSEYVAEAEAGGEVIITRHGKPAAKLISVVDADARKAKARAAIEALMRHREQMRAEGKTATIEELIAWKNEGRK
jgi:prevent-host-death family protein